MNEHTDSLLNDLLADAGLARAAALDRSLAAFRRGRARRRIARATAAVLPLLLLAAWLAQPKTEPPPQLATQPPREISPAVPQYIQGTTVRIVGDDELLRLLKGRPVALLQTARGKQVILFDEPASAQ